MGIDNLNSYSLSDIIHMLQKGPNQDVVDGKAKLLQDIVDKVDTPILKGLAMDVSTVLSNWFEDPKIICCLIQGLWSIYISNAKPNSGLTSLKISDTEFSNYIDILIAFIDLIIVLMSGDIKKLVFYIPDMLKEIMYGVMGAILVVLQGTLYSLRDSAMNSILKWIDNSTANISTDSIWAKCLPLSQFLQIVKKYVSDFGLLSNIEEKIKGYLSSMTSKFGPQKSLNLPKTVKDLEFLYWFRDLLLKMKSAVLNFDLCVSYQYIPSDVSRSDKLTDTNNNTSIDNNVISSKDYPLTQDNLGIKRSSDGTILVDRQKQAQENTIPLLSNSSIREFLNKYYGYPLDVVDSLLVGSTSQDSIIGTNINSSRLSDLNADCPNTPSPVDIMNWALSIRNREK